MFYCISTSSIFHSIGVQYHMFSTMCAYFLEALDGVAQQYLSPGADVQSWNTDLYPLWSAFLHNIFSTASETCTHHVLRKHIPTLHRTHQRHVVKLINIPIFCAILFLLFYTLGQFVRSSITSRGIN